MKNNITMTPSVSVVLAFYNEERFLPEAINSILKQTYSNYELILVDDGSKDDSGKIADKFAENDVRIRVFHSPNRGVSSARNIGIENSRGEWIMFLDGDDMYRPDAIETLLKYSDSVDMVCATAKAFPKERNWLEVKEITCFDKLTDVEPDFRFFFEQATFFRCVWAKLYRRSKLTVPWDENIPDIPDELFNIYNSLNFRGFRIIPDVVYDYRMEHAITLSTHFWTGILRTREKILKMWWDIFPDNPEVHEIILIEHLSRIGKWISELGEIDTLPLFYRQVILEEEIRYVASKLPEYDYEKLPLKEKRVKEIICQENNADIFDRIGELFKSEPVV